MHTKQIIAVVLIAITGIVIAVGCDTKAEETNDISTPVKTANVVTEEISIPIHTSGILSSDSEQKLSFKIPGIVEKIYVDEGERVGKGKLLAKLDLSEINAQVNQAQNAYDKALRDFERIKKLYDDEVATLEQLQNTETAMNVAAAQLEIAKFNQTHSEIFAPSTGRILKRFVETNELVNAGYPVFMFGSKGKGWKVKAGLTDKDIIKVVIGDKAAIEFDAYPGKKFTGTVTEVGESANPRNGTFEIEIQLEETDYKLSSGFVAKIDILPSSKTAYKIIPIEAIVEAEAKEAFLYSFTGDKANKKIIEIAYVIKDRVAVSSGLNDVEKVITEGSSYLNDGSKIKVVE